MKKIFQTFFDWYKRHYKINLYITAGLFVWQLVHLYWMGANVIGMRLFDHEFWHVGTIGNIIISVVDYVEVPAIILASLFYIHELQKEFSWKNLAFLVLINSQWLHLFWITDEIVIAQFTGTAAIALPLWLSWLAIFVDYLELPVIYDTVRRTILSLRKRA